MRLAAWRATVIGTALLATAALPPTADAVEATAAGCPRRVCTNGGGGVTITAHSGGTAPSPGSPGSSTSTASNVEQTCAWQGQKVPCTSGYGGTWSPTYNCYVKAAGSSDPTRRPESLPVRIPPPAGAEVGSGAWYGCQFGNFISLLWLASPPPVLPSPGELAQRAVATMRLSPIHIGMVPRSDRGYIGVIGLPVWMWVEDPSPSTFGPISTSATAGPMTVTAVGKVASIDWSMGDGTTITCRGSGTPYRESYGKRKSPTCGHVYDRTSADQPGDRYTVTATSHWVVTWAGGGQSGTITLDHTASSTLAEGELQTLVE